MADKCKCGDAIQHARAVEGAIMTSLFNASTNPDRENYWRSHADKLESKFSTDHGRHYSLFLYPESSL